MTAHTILSNAFSLNMISRTELLERIEMLPLHFDGENFVDTNNNKIKASTARSVVGHQETADILSEKLGVDVAFNRETVSLNGNIQMIVAQYKGERLPEGAKSLPAGATIEFVLVRFKPLYEIKELMKLYLIEEVATGMTIRPNSIVYKDSETVDDDYRMLVEVLEDFNQ